MKHNFRKLVAALAAVIMLLSACGENRDTPLPPQVDEPFTLTAAVCSIPNTLTPADCTTGGSETILYHLYENLMRWENNGYGFATLVPGQAASFTTETDYTGNITYIFTLRDDIYWSDGQAVSAYHFVSAWQHLADPAQALPHSELLRCISGYDAVQETGDTSLLGVAAPDSLTFVVTLSGSAPYFLEGVCASAYTMPVRPYLPGIDENTYITNGAYTVAEFSAGLVMLTKSETYYGKDSVTVDELKFIPPAGSDADYEKLTGGTIDLAVDLPVSALQELAQDESWRCEPVTTTYGFVFNTLLTPFDSAAVRTAFRLVIDEQSIVDALGSYTTRPATGLIPYGVSDYGLSQAAQAASETSDDSQSGEDGTSKPPLINPDLYWDFRTHSEEIITLDISDDYAADCTYARQLLADAGFAGGSGFPTVEYIYIDTPENAAAAQLLRTVWQKELGVSVALRAVTAEEYGLMLQPSVSEENSEETAPPAFQIAAMEFTASGYQDAGAFLSQWHSGNAANCAGYTSAAFDILINAATAAAAAETYDAYLHDAEAILLEESPVVPVFYRGASFALNGELTGLYRAPNGVFFFSQVTRSTAESES